MYPDQTMIGLSIKSLWEMVVPYDQFFSPSMHDVGPVGGRRLERLDTLRHATFRAFALGGRGGNGW